MEGPTAVAVKNAVIPIKPGNSSLKDMFLPMMKASVRKRGKTNPKIMTGPFK
jgi:hypothetical protein